MCGWDSQWEVEVQSRVKAGHQSIESRGGVNIIIIVVVFLSSPPSSSTLAMSSWYSPLGSWPPDHHCSPPLIIIKIINTVDQFYWQHNPCNENQSLKDQILRSALRLSRHRWQTSDHHCQFPIKDSAIPSHFHLCHQNFLIQVKKKTFRFVGRMLPKVTSTISPKTSDCISRSEF